MMKFWCCLFLMPLMALAAELIVPLDKALPTEGQFVPVDLSSVANAQQPLEMPADKVTIQKIPFHLVSGGDANHLFMKPIGWSAAENEGRQEYPGYMARYDFFPEPGDWSRATLEIPVADYASVYLLAAADDEESLTNHLTLRFGRFDGRVRTSYHDFTATIPRSSDASVKARSGNVVQVVPTESGRLYVVRIPINRAFSQDYQRHWAMHLDLTRELKVAINLPDPFRFQLRPLGDPSGVRIFAMTLERSSPQLELTAREPGNVFNQPQKPVFDLLMRNHYDHHREHHVEVETRRDDGEVQTFVFNTFRLWREGNAKQTLTLDLSERGHYDVVFRLFRQGQLLLERPTTLAILAPDTRKHRESSPFGTWDFGGGHETPFDIDQTGPLAVKAGLRYLRDSESHGLVSYRDVKLTPKSVEKLIQRKAQEPDFVPPARGLIFHENSVSGPHVLRSPDLFTGKQYDLTENDRERFEKLWTEAMQTFALMEEHFPETEIYFGNGMPHLIEEFCRQGIPHKYLKVAGNESGNFMRPPETQPTDFVANNAGIFMFRRVLDHYGYADTKVYQCFEMCYPNTNPGNLTHQTQAEYFVRHVMHSLAWRIPLIRVGLIADVGNSYYHSNWGAAGFCFGYPNVSPKRSYVAMAVMTQVLDGATFSRIVPTGSDAVYAFEYKRGWNDFVTCLWTTRGSRPVMLGVPFSGRAEVTRLYGREESLNVKNDWLTIGTAATFVRTKRPIRRLQLGEPSHAPPPEGDAFVISSLSSMSEWELEQERNYELESFNFMNQRRPGIFVHEEMPELAGREKVIAIEARESAPGTSEYLQRYTVMAMREPVEIPGMPTEVGLWVHDNATWGRVIFELEDAGGQRWISIGAEQGGEPNPWMADWLPKEEFAKLKDSGKAGISDWNSDDAWGWSRLNHDGWRYVKFPLPGQYGSNHDIYHWPYTSQWRFSGDGKVKYPLTFRKLVVTMPEKVLYGTDWRPLRHPRIGVSTLQVTYVPAEEAFIGE